MSVALLYALTAAVLFGISVYGLLSRPHLLRRLVALNMLGVSVFLLLIAFAHRAPSQVDPVPHAMVLTGIVIAVSTTAFGLALARRLYHNAGRVTLEEDDRPGDRRGSAEGDFGS